MLVQLRPSNEALPRARVPGAQDQYGCPSTLLTCALCEHRDLTSCLPSVSEVLEQYGAPFTHTVRSRMARSTTSTSPGVFSKLGASRTYRTA